MINVSIICQKMDREYLEKLYENYKGDDDISIFHDGWDGLLHIAEESQLDGIIIDVDIEACDDLRIIKIIKTLHPDVEIAFTSESERYALEGFQYGIVNYFKKPYTNEKLHETLEKIRERKSMRKKKDIYIKMFGAFELIIDGKNIKWNNSKSRELFCILVDARGASVSSEKIQSILWPNSDSQKAAASFHTSLHQLRKILEGHDIGDILEHNRGSQFVKSELFRCDVYEFEKCLEKGNKKAYLKAFELYKGHYLENENFSWKYFNRIRYEMRFEDLLSKI